LTDRRPEAVVFDLDGTLIDSIPLILESFRYTLRRHLGSTPDDATLISGIGTPLRTQLGRYCADPAIVEAMFVTYRAHNREHHDALLRSFPAVRDAIEALARAGLPLGIVTSKARDVALRGLDRCGLAPFFPPEVVVALEDCAVHKPDPAPVRLGCARVGVDPSRAVYVGDSTHDLRAGRAAGARTAAVAWGPFPRAELEACEPNWFCEHPDDLVRAFVGQDD
jgi:pyrophosphatase PpaX